MSNRSLAAARNRRSPQEVVNGPGLRKDTSTQLSSRMPPPPPPSNGSKPTGKSFSKEGSSASGNTLPNKLSVSDAIGLITIRLSKVEGYLLKEQHEGHTSNHNSSGSSVTDVDTALRNLVSRLNVVEKTQHSLDQNLEELNNTVRDLEASTPVNELLPPTPAVTDPGLLERLEKTEKDLSEVKQLVIKLQTMLIDVTMAQKFAPSIPSMVPVTPPLMIRTNSVFPGFGDEEEGEGEGEREEYDDNEPFVPGSMHVNI